jgi:hypothetical protein
MLAQSTFIDNYPATTAAQIEEHYPLNCPYCAMGKMRKRTVHEMKQKYYDESDVNSISQYNKIAHNINLDSIVERAIPLSTEH